MAKGCAGLPRHVALPASTCQGLALIDHFMEWPWQIQKACPALVKRQEIWHLQSWVITHTLSHVLGIAHRIPEDQGQLQMILISAAQSEPYVRRLGDDLTGAVRLPPVQQSDDDKQLAPCFLNQIECIAVMRHAFICTHAVAT